MQSPAYDASGNATTEGALSYGWNAESQLKSAAGVNYLYDGDGRRVSKSNGKLYWYGAGSEILAETTASGSTLNEYIFFGGKRVALLPASSTAQFYVEDSLGTSRVVTNNTGGVCYDADFYPFGGERPYTNSCTQNNYKFEGKERDTETSNDDFGARYYSNRFGRWLSADWSGVPVAVPYANLTNPQTLNLYSMVADDPESFADLDGHKIDDSSLRKNKKYQHWKKQFLKSKEGRALWKKLDKNSNLLVAITLNSKKADSQVTDKKWDDSGHLTSATVTFSSNSMDTNKQMNSTDYPFGSTLNDDHSKRVEYVFGHELGHVADADTAEGRADMQGAEKTYDELQQMYNSLSRNEYMNSSVVADLASQNQAYHTNEEHRADAEGRRVVETCCSKPSPEE